MDTTSLNLHGLATSLNTNTDAWEVAAGKELGRDFRAAAQCITALYRSGRQASKRSYDAGYISACQDLLSMIQHGVSVGGEPELSIGKIMDWVEARLDAVKARQEEEIEEEQQEKEKSKTSPKIRTRPYPSSPSPPPPPPPTVPPPPAAATNATTTTSTVTTPTIPRRTIPKQRSTVEFPSEPPLLGKRRHAVMLLDSTTTTTSTGPSGGGVPSGSPLVSVIHPNTPSSGFRNSLLSASDNGTIPANTTGGGGGGGGTPRRRTWSWRTHSQNQPPPPSTGLLATGFGFRSGEAMDVEEEARERKRVSRR